MNQPTHAGARAIAAIVIRHAHFTTFITEVGAARQVIKLVPIASIAKRINPSRGVAR